MPESIQAVQVVGVKMADGAVQLSFLDQVGGLRYQAVIANADFTSLNTTVNGGSTGATVTLVYAENTHKGDYTIAAERV